MNSSILVTGAAGFIGSHLALRLVNSGYQVLGLDNFDDYYSEDIKRNNIKLVGNTSQFQLVEGDIRDASLLEAIFSHHSFRTIIHLAARAGVRPSVERPLIYQDVNVMGTLNLLQACRGLPLEKFILASSSSVYGINTISPFREDAAVDCPVSPYAASKASAELFCRTYHHLYHLPIIILRLFTVYGPRQRPEMAIHRFAQQIDRGETVSIFGDGTSRRDYTYVDDIVDGFMAALEYPGDSFQIFNLGGGKTVNLRYLLEVMEKTLNKPARIKYTEAVPGDVPITMADITKAKNLLNYNPKIGIEEGIHHFILWYQQHKEL